MREFAAELGLDYALLNDDERGDVFEKFATFHILRRFHDQEIEPHMVSRLANGRALGAPMDCVIMLIDGRLIEATDAIDDIVAEANDSLAVAFVLVGATRANRFDPPRVQAYVDGAIGFFDGSADCAALSDRRNDMAHLRARAYQAGVRLDVSVFGYYAALGSWSEESGAAMALDVGRKRIGAVPWIRGDDPGAPNVEFEAVDRGRLLDLIATGLPLHSVPEQALASVELEDYAAVLPARGLVELPRIKGVDSGYFGYVPIDAFLSLLEREDGQGLREAIFTQNVRGYQGDGGVNARIRETLSSKERAQFVLRNNGVTVVADEIASHGADIALTNYQIVNGLQTSTVIYRIRDLLRDAQDVHVPVKIIASQQTPVRRAIIDATNRQTPITGASLFAACEKAVAIEQHFLGRMRAGGPAFVLERRPGQYASTLKVERMSLEELLRSFYAVFLERSHLAERGFAAIAPDVDDGLLAPSLTPEPYYVAARLLQFVRDTARRHDEPRLTQVDFHAALGLRILCAPAQPPLGDASAMRTLCRRIETRLNSEHLRDELSHKVLSITQSPRDRMRSRVHGVAQLKRTRDSVVRRAREEALPEPEA